MKIIRSGRIAAALFAGAVGLAALSIVFPTNAQNSARQAASSRYVSPPGYIKGTVQGEKGPEAGVWVIAETKELSTGMIKIVVTDDQGRYRAARIAGGELTRSGCEVMAWWIRLPSR